MQETFSGGLRTPLNVLSSRLKDVAGLESRSIEAAGLEAEAALNNETLRIRQLQSDAELIADGFILAR